MKKYLTVPIIATVVMALWVLKGLVFLPKAEADKPDIYGFAELPVLLDGRTQPIDSTARNAMRVIRHKSTALRNEGDKEKPYPAVEWLLEVAAKPELARSRPVFRIDNEEVKDHLGLAKDEKHFSVDEVAAEKNFQRLAKDSARIHAKQAELRTPFEKSIKGVADSLMIYQRLAKSFRPQHSTDFKQDLDEMTRIFPAGMSAVRAHETGAEHDEDEHQQFSRLLEVFIDPTIHEGDKSGVMFWPRTVPPVTGGETEWKSMSASLFHSITNAAQPESEWKIEFNGAAQSYAAMLSAYAKDDAATFNAELAAYREHLEKNNLVGIAGKTGTEFGFNNFDPFYKCEILYVIAFLLACGSWLSLAKWPNQTAYYLVALAAVVHTAGLIFRMWLEGRPPVTNLYSAAVFVGWGAVILGLILERIYRDGIGNVVASSVGFVTLLVAHGLSLSGDTMEMLQAVLDTNFWLATHVVIITIGYSATFVAGFLAIVYVVRDFVSNKVAFDKVNRTGITKMIYGIVCFATLFSFVGTVLGGIWADQSWGRFWGWDPKENGALMIVIWNAAILHARWGGIIRERGIVAASIFGNVITAWSFFGTNMLGIGLHSYGFMDKAFAWLMVFVCSQIVIMTGGLMLGTLDNAGKAASQKDGAAAASPLPWLIVEGGVIVITAAGAIIYLLKAFGF